MYNGNTHVNGPAHVRELPNLIISKITVGPYNNNSYLLRCANTGTEVLIDAAAEPDRLLTLVGPGGLMGVLTTHGHHDHWGALEALRAVTNRATEREPTRRYLGARSLERALQGWIDAQAEGNRWILGFDVPKPKWAEEYFKEEAVVPGVKRFADADDEPKKKIKNDPTTGRFKSAEEE